MRQLVLHSICTLSGERVIPGARRPLAGPAPKFVYALSMARVVFLVSIVNNDSILASEMCSVHVWYVSRCAYILRYLHIELVVHKFEHNEGSG